MVLAGTAIMKALLLDRAAAAAPPVSTTPVESADTRLVHRCLEGDEQAWAELLEKYKRLIYSIPIKFGLASEEANDIFQDTCVELLSELPRLREPRALPKWLMQVTARKCVRVRDRNRRTDGGRADAELLGSVAADAPLSDDVLFEVAREQALRDAVSALPPRCAALVQMLFFEAAPRPYNEIADSLAIARGSIGFIRGRCLRRLRVELQKHGFC
jgi:RNA polymerase sigma factor (sigma-70 family)